MMSSTCMHRSVLNSRLVRSYTEDLVLYLVWDSESESSKDMTILGSSMEVQDDSSSEQPMKKDKKAKEKKRRRSSSSTSSSTSCKDRFSPCNAWFHSAGQDKKQGVCGQKR